jgi:SAM-dependent methyltransferase
VNSSISTSTPTTFGSLPAAITAYWNEHVHDLQIATHPVGTIGFFQELETYRFEKLDYLPQLVDFSTYRGKCLLEIGCGVGLDLKKFAQAGAIVTGIDLAPVSIDLAHQYFRQNRLHVDLQIMNGEELAFENSSFDVVYAHGVLPYAADFLRMIKEIYRVLRPGGEAILMVYNKYSWLNAISKLTKVKLEHTDAPVFNKHSVGEFKRALHPFDNFCIIPARFPVKTRLHYGLKAKLFNRCFVNLFNLLPQPLIRSTGWHLVAFAYK